MKKEKRQYTIRNIPDRVDRVLKKRARATGKSFNQIALDALIMGAGEPLVPKRDLSFIIGSMTANEVAEMDQSISAQRQIDPSIWK